MEAGFLKNQVLWTNQMQELEVEIRRFIKYINDEFDPHSRTMMSLLKFVVTMFDFFYDVKFNRTKLVELIDSDIQIDPRFAKHIKLLREKIKLADGEKLSKGSEQFPIDFILNTLLQQSTTDFLRLQQSYNQEQSQKNIEVSSSTEMAKALALRALQPAITAGVLENYSVDSLPSILTYQAARVEIRILPYCETLLIGFPVTAFYSQTSLIEDGIEAGGDQNEAMHISDIMGMTETDDLDSVILSPSFLALAHEVGHKVFNHGFQKIDDGLKISLEQFVRHQLQLQLSKKGRTLDDSRWIFSRLEEMFSDAYGCLIDGPVAVVGFKELMEKSRPAGLSAEDDEYPNAPLRTYIQTEMLRRMQEAYRWPEWVNDAADTIDSMWHEWVKENWSIWVRNQWPFGWENSDGEVIKGATYLIGDKKVTGQYILDELSDVIDVMVDALEPIADHIATRIELDNSRRWQRLYRKNTIQSDGAVDESLFKDYTKHAVEQLKDPVQFDSRSAMFELPQSTSEIFANISRMGAHEVLDALVVSVLFSGWSDEGGGEVGWK